MTAHDTNLPDTPASRTGTTPDTPITRACGDRVTVVVWRINSDTVGEADVAGTSDAGDSRLAPRLARDLVAIYSDVHGTVIDFGADINLQHAAETTGRAYSTITDATILRPATHLPRPATLILLRWPRPETDGAEPDATRLVSRCQQHLADDGSIIVIVTATQPGADGTRCSDYEQVLLPAAQSVGLRHLHDVVPIDAADGRDVFTYTTADDTTASKRDSDLDTPRRITTTLVIFGHPGRRP